MLVHYIKSLRENGIIKGVNAFLYSKWFCFAVAAAMAISNVFAIDFLALYFFCVAVIFITLFSPDTYPEIPIACCCYMIFSAKNNPAKNFGQTLLSARAGAVQFVVICSLVGACVIARLVFDALVLKRQKKIPSLTLGFAILGLSYVLGGLLLDDYLKSALFGLIQILSLCGLYFYFYFTVDWSKRSKADFALIFTAVGVGMVIEIAGMYLQPNVLQAIKEGTFKRGHLGTGWGIYNNVGYAIAICIPAPFYFASVKKNGFLYALLGCLFGIATVFTQSRGSIVSGGAVFIACVAFAVIFSKDVERKKNIMALGSVFVLCLAFILTPFADGLFKSLVDRGMDDSGRFEIYQKGFENFLNYPVFGGGFYMDQGAYRINGLPEDSFLPGRYHNTIIQLISSGGAVMLLAYIFHRLQTLRLILKERSIEKTFMGLSILVLLLASMLDCHFFNFGPGLHYAVLLIFAEMSPRTKENALLDKEDIEPNVITV